MVNKIKLGAVRRREVEIRGPAFLPQYDTIGVYFEIPAGQTATLIERAVFKSNILGEVKWWVEGYEELPPPTLPHQEGPYR